MLALNKIAHDHRRNPPLITADRERETAVDETLFTQGLFCALSYRARRPHRAAVGPSPRHGPVPVEQGLEPQHA